MRRKLRKFNNFAVTWALIVTALAWGACEDHEVADHNPEFRPAPTVERAPTVQTAPTVETAPTVAKFEGFKEAPTATKFEGFEQAPTVTQADAFKQAPTATQFEGFTEDDNPCATFLEQPSPQKQNVPPIGQWDTSTAPVVR